jgi:peroxiredoxin
VVEGDPASDFELPRLDAPGHTVRLSSFAGRCPVALVFGSYT